MQLNVLENLFYSFMIKCGSLCSNPKNLFTNLISFEDITTTYVSFSLLTSLRQQNISLYIFILVHIQGSNILSSPSQYSLISSLGLRPTQNTFSKITNHPFLLFQLVDCSCMSYNFMIRVSSRFENNVGFERRIRINGLRHRYPHKFREGLIMCAFDDTQEYKLVFEFLKVEQEMELGLNSK